MTNSSNSTVIVNDFTVIQVKLNETSQAVHYLYIKEHSVRDTHPCKPNGRTVFVLNVPPFVTEEAMKQIFSECGAVQRVFLHAKPSSGPPPPQSSESPETFFQAQPLATGYQVAYIVYHEKSSVKRAKTMSYSKERYFCTARCPLVTGIEKWRAAYISSAPPPADRLKAEVETYMLEYDKTVEEEKQAAKESEGVPDEEGWIKVTKQSKNKVAARTDAQERRLKRKLRKRNREKDLLHFYKFQARESKKEHITQLRQKFEEDKRQIALMKAARKFRPY